jgi:transposase InsO family protein
VSNGIVGWGTRYTDQELTGEIAQSIAGSPFHGKGHRKVWARLRLAGVRTSKRRVLRLMREHGLLAPARQPQPAEPKRHDGTILAERPNQMWGIDATAGFTAQDGQVAIFAMVDHYLAYCLGIHAAKRGTRLKPSSQCARPYRSSLLDSSKPLRLACGCGTITALSL